MNEMLEVVISDALEGGRWLGRTSEGVVVFASGDAAPGERVVVKPEIRRANRLEGRVVERLSSSPDRVEAPCPWFGRCGGCTWQHLRYETELRAKVHHVTETLHRMGGVSGFELLETLAGEQRYGTRNKLELSAGRGSDGKLVLGFHGRARGRPVLPVEACLLGESALLPRLPALAEALDRAGITPWHAKSGKGLLRSLVLRRSRHTGDELALWMVARKGRERTLRQCAGEALGEAVPGLRMAQAWMPGRAATGLVRSVTSLQGDPWLEEQVGPFLLRVPAAVFLQVHTALMPAFYQAVVDLAELGPGKTVWELYAGLGALTLFLHRSGARVYAWEGHREAVDAAAHNFEVNKAGDLNMQCADLNRSFTPALPEPDVVVADPPRGGLSPAILQGLLQKPVRNLVYVSCHPAALARDARRLCAQGAYRLTRIKPVDLFPATLHLETIACFSGTSR